MVEIPDGVARRLVELLPWVDVKLLSQQKNGDASRDAHAIADVLSIQLRYERTAPEGKP